MDARKENTTRAAHDRSDERKAADDARLPVLVHSPSHVESYPLVGRMWDIFSGSANCRMAYGIIITIYIQTNASITSGTLIENRLCFLGDILFCGLSRQAHADDKHHLKQTLGDHTSQRERERERAKQHKLTEPPCSRIERMGVFVFRGALQVKTAVSGIMRPGTERNDRLRPTFDGDQQKRTSIPTGGRRYEN